MEKLHLWLSSTEHRFAPRELRSAGGAFSPLYSPSGSIYCVISEAGHAYLYRMKDDGTQEEKVSTEPIVYLSGISPDERFVVVRRPLNREDNWWDVEAVPVAGGPWVPLCSGWCEADWSRDGKVMYFYWRAFSGNSRTYVVPISHGSDLPKLPNRDFNPRRSSAQSQRRCWRKTFLRAPTSPATPSARKPPTGTSIASHFPERDV